MKKPFKKIFSFTACREAIGSYHYRFGLKQPHEAATYCSCPHSYCSPLSDLGCNFCHHYQR